MLARVVVSHWNKDPGDEDLVRGGMTYDFDVGHARCRAHCSHLVIFDGIMLGEERSA